MKIKLTIAYDGTRYSGWQTQPNATTIQETIENVLEVLLKERAKVIGSGRTDAGVHAEGQVAHFTPKEPLDERKLLVSLNGLLPPDIRIKQVEAVADTFHARFNAKKKTYHYHLYFPRVQNPFRQAFHWQVYDPLNLEKMHEAASHFVGTHNFQTFTNEGGAAKNFERTLYRLDLVPVEDGLRLEFEGNGFLYKMVRNITGHLVETARGKCEPDQIPALLAGKDRKMASRAAPPHGLFLHSVSYGTDL